MKKNFPSSLVFRVIVLLSFFNVISTAVQAQTIKYQYDALGRVTFVEDATNGNRDYDYDPAGNRLLVSIATPADSTAEPGSATSIAPATPTGLGCSQIAAGAWKATWNTVSGATYYIYRTNSESGSETTESGPGVVKTSTCKWVQACNAANVCSAKANF